MDPLALRVTRRFTAGTVRMAFIGLDLERDDVEGNLEKGLTSVSKALALSKRAEAELPKFEREARELHDQAVAALLAVDRALLAVPSKDSQGLAAEVRKDVDKIRGQNWTAALTVESGFTNFVIRTFDQIRKSMRRLISKPEVQALQQIMATQVAPVQKGLRALQDKFEAEFTKYGDEIAHEIEYVEIMEPPKRGAYGTPLDVPDTGDHDSYNNLHDTVRRTARYLTQDANGMHQKLVGLTYNLEEMVRHLVETQRAVKKYLYK